MLMVGELLSHEEMMSSPTGITLIEAVSETGEYVVEGGERLELETRLHLCRA